MAAFLIVVMLAGCGEEDKLAVKKGISARNRPQLSTSNVMTLISDSGYTKYKVLTPLWKVYNESADKSYWDFPKGVYLRQLDKDLKEVSMVAADSACYFPGKKIWELYGRVEIEQKDKTYFYSERIFFDDRKKLIFSDAFIHIKTPTQILEGTGFESNMDLTRYRVLKPSGVFPSRQHEPTGRAQAAFESAEAEGPTFMDSPSGMHEHPDLEERPGEKAPGEPQEVEFF